MRLPSTKGRGSRLVLALVLGASALGVVGCPRKATYLPNDKGGYTLLTTTNSLEQALIRFKRTAEDLCTPSRPYQLSTPVTVDRGTTATPGGPVTTMTVRTELTCE
ncbi:MAG: hypothetical protein L0206_23995 [Actinobacteria bacterium]|nr:hypothetical protein [Actinomycetota bacterium]